MVKKGFLSAVLLLILISVGVEFALHRESTPPKKMTDLEALQDPEASFERYRDALMNLAKAQHPAALKAALTQRKARSVLRRMTVAEALGYFPDDVALEAILELLQDRSETVRVRALRGLAHFSSPRRVQILQDRARAGERLPVYERAAVYESLLSVSRSKRDRERAIEYLADYAAKGTDPDHDNAAFKLATEAPRSLESVFALKQKLFKTKNKKLKAIAIRNLKTLDPKWLAPRLIRLSKDRRPLVQVAVIHALPDVCPKNRWLILEEVLKRTQNQQVFLEALKAPLAVGGEGALEHAKAVYSKIHQARGSGSVEAQTAKMTLDRLQSGSAPQGRCSRK